MENHLLNVAISFLQDEFPEVSDDKLLECRLILDEFIKSPQNFDKFNRLLFEKIGKNETISKINRVLVVSQSPQSYVLPDVPELGEKPIFGRRKARPWTYEEDIRLLSGIHIYGIDNWNAIVPLVGAGRTRPQCSQRWFRGIDPKISKRKWSEEEDNHLMSLVDQFGENSWSKVSNQMGDRSDVQCRYHYFQIKKLRENPKNKKKSKSLLKGNSRDFKKEDDLDIINSIFKHDDSFENTFNTSFWVSLSDSVLEAFK